MTMNLMQDNLKSRLVIFDFDGTLADSMPWLYSMIDHLVEKFNFDQPSKFDLESIRTNHTRDMMKKYKVSFWKMLRMSRYVQKHMQEDIHLIQLFPDMESVLNDLHELGVQLALVTSNSLQNVEKVLGPEICSLFDHYECGVSILGKKSKFKKVLKKTRTTPDQALCIGDEIRDLEAAHQAGIAFGAVSWGYTLPEVLSRCLPQELFHTVNDITRAVIQG